MRGSGWGLMEKEGGRMGTMNEGIGMGTRGEGGR